MPARDASTLLGGLTPRRFLERHWQKKPLLIRNAFPRFTPPLTPEELAGLACETGVESRLVMQTRRAPGWKLRQGPFRHKDFTGLPRSRWTLLVQDVDKHVPAVSRLLDPFRFIPNWRIDDVMASYAADGGSVGPHVDAYDVFLLQAQGMRRWDIHSGPQEELTLPGLELKQVRRFTPEESWLLMPGDMLYLPPGMAHHGVAFGDCITFSIGFRAPTHAEMLADFTSLLLQQAAHGVHYTDPNLLPASHPGEIPAAARARARRMLRAELKPSDETLDVWFGRFMTEPKPWLKPNPPARRTDSAKLHYALVKGKRLDWHPAVRVAWFSAKRICHLFVDGEHHPLSHKLAGFAALMGDSRGFSAKQLLRLLDNPQVCRLLLQWLDAGQLVWQR